MFSEPSAVVSGEERSAPTLTVVVLHALGSSGDAFSAVARHLPDSWRVIGVDLPGFGGEDAAADTGVDATVDHVLRRIRASSPGRWVLVGHSMGAKIAALVARRALDGTAAVFGLVGVVLLAGSPPCPEPMSEDRRAEMIGWAADGRLDDAAIDTFLDANTAAALTGERRERAVADLRRTEPAAWRRWLEVGAREDRVAEVGILDVPALILAGAEDDDLGVDAQRELNAPVYPRAQVAVVAEAAHLLPLEQPEQVAALLVDWWDDVAAGSVDLAPDWCALIASSRVDPRLRGVLAKRFLPDTGEDQARFTPAQLHTLRLVSDQVVPQTGVGRIDLAARVAAQLARGEGDGWRPDTLPVDQEAYRIALDALVVLHDRTDEERRALLAQVAAGEWSEPGSGWNGAQFADWFADAANDLVRQWVAHPAVMARMGFDGFAVGGLDDRPAGFTVLDPGRTDPWQPTPGEETR